jgi:RimJ/RimL family protein N-acetyltransferase
MNPNDSSEQPYFELCLATQQDMMITFEWASNPYLRKFSPNSGSIPMETHQRWFLKKLQDSNCRFYIVKINGKPAGTCRLDFVNFDAPVNAEISYLLDPQFHGKGLGIKTIEELVEKAKLELTPAISRINLIAKVHKQNVASLRIFEKAGFVLTSPEKSDQDHIKNPADEKYVVFNRTVEL